MNDKRQEFALEYAGFWIRVAAALIDLIILIGGLYILYCVMLQSLLWIFPEMQKLMLIFRDMQGAWPASGNTIWLIATVLLVFLIGSTLYFVLSCAGGGQTVGKMSVGIKVIRTDSSRVDLRSSFIRFLGSVLCVATFGIGFIYIAFNERKQGLHDLIADTYVVKLPVKQVIYDRSLAGGQIG